jgi:tetratricopeptide (TPR) repeat protein
VLRSDTSGTADAELDAEHRFLITYAQIICANALCDDDLHVQSVPLWDSVIEAIDRPGPADEPQDHLLVQGATGYGRFCIETGRLGEAEPWLRRAGARAESRGWELARARTQLERGTAAWAAGDVWQTQTLVHDAYPAIAEGYRAHDVSRSWLYLGLIAMALDKLDDADERFGHAERHWREVEKPLHIHRILLQRSWIDILANRFDAAAEKAAEARELLDSWPRHSWLQYARLDDHEGSILRARALADPDDAADKLEQAADLKVPAALAVDSVRHAIVDADARMRWATLVSARILAGAFAVVHEWGNTELLSELVEYHCARGAFSTEPTDSAAGGWAGSATAAVPVEAEDEYALVAAGSPSALVSEGLTRLGPLPPLRMDPDMPPIMSRYRDLARERYGRDITSNEGAWSTWP